MRDEGLDMLPEEAKYALLNNFFNFKTIANMFRTQLNNARKHY